ncbi:hypothetical protein ACSBR1_013825 [Camellia fascicularis]
MYLLSWNIRGLGREIKRRKIRKVLKDEKVDMVFFQETKRDVISFDMVRSVWPFDRFEFLDVGAIGFAGGLLCVWNPAVFSLHNSCCSRNFIVLAGKINSEFEGVLVNLYAPNNVVKRRDLWDLVIRIRPLFPKPWCIGGDFNEIRCMSERIGCSRRNVGMQDFNEFIDKLEGVKLSMLGRRFTWSNSSDNGKWSCIDRFILDSDWLAVFNFKCWGLPRSVSDHCPIIMKEDSRDWGPKPFRFMNCWVLHSGFLPMVEKVWIEAEKHLKEWNVSVFGILTSQLKLVEEEFIQLDLLAKSTELLAAELSRKAELRELIWKLSKRAEWFWLQKSRQN